MPPFVRAAAAAKTPVAIEGGGTKRDIGRPAQSERTLSCAGLTGITLYEPAEMVIAAWAGTPLAEVQCQMALVVLWELRISVRARRPKQGVMSSVEETPEKAVMEES